MKNEEILIHVDHTLLKAVSTWKEIRLVCREALDFHTASVCIPPSFVKRAKEEFPELNICTVIGFPLGYQTTEVKAAETKQALSEGASEIDMVVNLGDVKAGEFQKVTEEIRVLKELTGSKILKVIIEACYLTREEKIALCHCVTEGKADYIKTSTGFGTGGAALEDIELFKEFIGPAVKIKAAGGIRTRVDMEQFLNAGCDRIGSSATASVVK